AVVGLDVDPKVVEVSSEPSYLGLVCDVTDEATTLEALEAAVRTFGGLDMVVLNAGVFPGGRRLETLQLVEWHRVMRTNLDANVTLLREVHPMLRAAPRGGRVVIVGSRNVRAP